MSRGLETTVECYAVCVYVAGNVCECLDALGIKMFQVYIGYVVNTNG